MANLIFPTNPSNGQKFTFNGKVFVYNSTTQRWSVTRAQLLGSLPDDVTIDAPTLGVSLSTVALDTVGANIHVTYTVDQDVDASLSVTGIEDTTATLHKSNNTIVVTAGATEFSGGQISLVVSNGRSTDTEVINVSAAYTSFDLTTAVYDGQNTSATDAGYKYDFDVSADGTKLYAVGSGMNIGQWSLSTPYDLTSTLTFEHLFETDLGWSGGSSIAPFAIKMSNDGTKFWISESGQTKGIFQFSCATPYDISTRSYDLAFTVNTTSYYPLRIEVSADGHHFYVMEDDYIIYQYYLSTPNDLATASYIRNVSTGYIYVTEMGNSAAGSPNDFAFNADGSKIYISSQNGSQVTVNYVMEFDVSTPWNISTWVKGGGNINTGSATNILNVGSDGVTSGNITFNPTGTKLYLMTRANGPLNQWTLS